MASIPVRALVVALGLVASSAPAVGQGTETMEEGVRLLGEQRWAEAAATFRALTAREPRNGVAWYRLGIALQEGGDPEDAIPALTRAAGLGFQAPYAFARIARAHASLGDAAAALDALESAVSQGLDMPALLEHADLAPIADHPRFADAARATRRAAEPCRYIDDYRNFDFWIGAWDVFDREGRRIGENVIEELLGSCALQENWTDVNGNQGRSLNVYDRGRGTWRQLWVSDRGVVTDYSTGRLHDGAMDFRAVELDSGGDTLYRRMIFTPVSRDTVTQEIFESRNGKDWESTWIGTYVRREPVGRDA